MGNNEIDKLATECLDDLVEHLLQNSVNSSHIKKIKDNLTKIKSLAKNEIEITRNSTIMSHNQPKRRASTLSTGDDSIKDDALLISFALSKFDHALFNSVFGLNLNQGDVIEMLAAILGVKPTTLRNYRDAFDSHVVQVRSGRVGWKKPLAAGYKSTKAKFDALSEDELTEIVVMRLKKIKPNVELIVKISYGFLFASRTVKTTNEVIIDGARLEAITVPHSKGIAYMVFAGFGNALTKGIYPAIYAYRDFGKVFVVFGESVTFSPDHKWELPRGEYLQIADYFSAEDLQTIKSYPHSYLTNNVFQEYALDKNSLGYGEYKLEIAEKIAEGLTCVIETYRRFYEKLNNSSKIEHR